MKFAFLLSVFFLCAVPARAHYSDLQIRDWADVILSDPDHPSELDDPSLHAVTNDFGPTVIPLSQLPIESDLAVADKTPWSSWWFPKIDRDLFDNGSGTSPLERYDIIRTALTGKLSQAAAWEKKLYSPDRPRWEGLCDAWAIAATQFPEPKAPRTVNVAGGSVTFSIGDQKALLLSSVDAIPAESLKIYGQRFTGNADGWIFPDLFPQELHRYVEKQLFERHKLFIMDHDPGVEVWSEPVFQANYKISAIAGRTDAVFVRLWLYSATSYTDKSQKDQTGIHQVVREYNYILYGRQDGAGNLVVESGEWVKGDLVDSRRDHPDFVYAVTDRFQRNSQNPEIDAKIVDKILGR